MASLATHTPPAEAPVFVLTMHRGGGTLLARILNCHPQLVLWGEHVGIANRLAEIDDMVTRVGRLMVRKTDEQVAEYAAFPDRRLTEFDPWANPFDYDSFRASCRQMIAGIFTRGLGPDQRWGFKEIRYHRPLTARFLQKLFPAARFVVLDRDLAEVVVSAVLASWSLRWFWDYRHVMPVQLAREIVDDATYATLAIKHGLADVAAALGPDCLAIDYAALLQPARRTIPRLFDFCGLPLSDFVTGRIDKVLAVKAGTTDRSVAFGGVLSEAFIRTRIAEIEPEMRARIASQGVDHQRLIARSGPGRYSFLMGDHTLHDQKCEFSSLF